MRARASAPGKTILMGEHSAVFGAPALVTAIDRRLTVDIGEWSSNGVVLDLVDIGVNLEVGWDEIVSYSEHARRAWQNYSANRSVERLSALIGSDPAHLVKVALGESAASTGGPSLDGVRVEVRSRIPVGSGFGSSAATAAAISAAYFAWQGAGDNAERLRRVTYEIEKRQHGAPSGIDNACVVTGGVVWCERDSSGMLQIRSHPTAAEVMSQFRIIDTGRPCESTGEVVAAVSERVEQRPDVIEMMAASTTRFAGALGAIGEEEEMSRQIRVFESCLEDLGVVPPAVCELVREVERCGGAAKISGAGTLTGSGAGALLVYHRQPETIGEWSFFERYGARVVGDVGLGAPGVESKRIL